MKSRITNNLSEEEVTIIEREFTGSYHLRKRIVELLEREQEALYVSMRSDDFKSPNWDNIHAYKLGEAKSMAKLITLLS